MMRARDMERRRCQNIVLHLMEEMRKGGVKDDHPMFRTLRTLLHMIESGRSVQDFLKVGG